MITAYRLFTLMDGSSSFEKGTIKNLEQIETDYFFFHEDPAERNHFDWHPAPRKQYVITLRGVLEFTVTNGDTFEIHPGDILIAEDVLGTGHKWRLLSEESWIRSYVVLKNDSEDGFLSETANKY